MSPRPSLRLPTLTLFTKEGGLCSLCEVAKNDLRAVAKVAPFHLRLYDIAKQGPSDDLEYERTAWRRLYQYDIPVLHFSADDSLDGLAGRSGRGGRVMKHRIDKDKLATLVREWTQQMNQAEEPATASDAPKRIAESVLSSPITKRPRAASLASRRQDLASPPHATCDDDPPLFLVTASPSAIVDDSHHASFGLGFSYDYFPSSTSTLEILGEMPRPPPTILNHLRPARTCFNCDSPSHTLRECPFRHDAQTISTARAAHASSRSGPSTPQRLGVPRAPSARARLLGFVERFRPGVVSGELRAALGRGRERCECETREWEWVARMRSEGYPRGWTMRQGEKDPLALMREHVLCATQDEADDEVADLAEMDDLVVYGADPLQEDADSPLDEDSPSITRPLLSSPSPTIDPPPPPSTAPPPPPSAPPPPPPLDPPPALPLAATLLHLVDYHTSLFDSHTHWVAWRASDAHEALAHVSPTEALMRQRNEERERVRDRRDCAGILDGEEEMDLAGGSSDED